MLYTALHNLKISHHISKRFLTDKFIPFRLFYAILRKVSFNVRIRRNNHLFKVPIRRGIGFINLLPDYEKWMSETVLRLIESEDSVFIDIGANTGQTLLRVVPYFPKIKYFAIEPNHLCTDYLENLCKINRFDSVNIHNVALSDKPGETELLLRYDDDILATTSSSFRKFTRYSTKMKVETMTGDALFRKEGFSDTQVIIKIDVEGGESKVMEGMVETIKAYRPLIICEILPLASKDLNVSNFRESSASAILLLLKQIGYQAFNIETKKKVNTIQDISTSLKSSNYLFVPEELYNTQLL